MELCTIRGYALLEGPRGSTCCGHKQMNLDQQGFDCQLNSPSTCDICAEFDSEDTLFLGFIIGNMIYFFALKISEKPFGNLCSEKGGGERVRRVLPPIKLFLPSRIKRQHSRHPKFRKAI